MSCRVEPAALWDFAFVAELSSCRAVDADQAVNAGIASLTCCQLSTSIHRLALHPAGYCSQLWWWIRGLSAWIAPPFLLGPTLETIKIRTDNDLLQRAALGRSLAKTHQFLAHTQIITKIFALEAGSLRNPYTVRIQRKTQSLFSVFCFHRPSQIRFQLISMQFRQSGKRPPRGQRSPRSFQP